MVRYSHDPKLDAELAAIAAEREAERNAPPEPHPLEGKLEPDAPNYDAWVSIAISLKRIADAWGMPPSSDVPPWAQPLPQPKDPS